MFGKKTSKIINHPNWDKQDLEGKNDIALIKLAEPIAFTNEISPACMPNGRKITNGDKLMVTGWGDLVEGGSTTPDELQQVDIRVNPDTDCTTQFDYKPLVASQFCAGITGDKPKDACQGDSGGPAVKYESRTNTFWLAGIVSMGPGCAGHGIYSEVSEFESWINSVMANN